MSTARRLLASAWEHWLAQLDAAGLRLFAEDAALVEWAARAEDRHPRP